MDKLNMNTVTVLCGVEYATVESRVRAFCSEYQNGQILTELVKNDDRTGEVIFKAHAVVDGVIKGTGHAMEMRGSSNINKTSHIECAETSAIGRALAFIGYMSSGNIASYEEIENAKLQRAEMKKHERMIKENIARLSIKYKKAIDEENGEELDECEIEMYEYYSKDGGLYKAVKATLSKEQANYIRDRQDKQMEERSIKRAKTEIRNQAYAKEFAEKQKKKNLNG
jgi:hypothetical protein